MSPSQWTAWPIAIVVLSSLGVLGCGRLKAKDPPSVSFTRVPPFGPGSARKLDTIEGRATGARDGQKIVLYAKSGEWWVQPLADKPFTAVAPDFTWKNQTHPGTSYAALLVAPDYRPNAKSELLPEKGGPVLAVATTTGPDAPAAGAEKTLLFAGYEWVVRQTESKPGGSYNDYSPGNAWVDSDRRLHLKISGEPGHWTSGEVNLRRSLGYGSYRFVVRNLSPLEPAAAFVMQTWDDSGPYREMDIEISKWGETYIRNGQFVIQPYHIPANTVQFQVPEGTVTFMMRWSPGRAAFRAFRRAVARWDSTPVREHVFTSGVPAAGSERVHMNLYVFDHNRNPLRHENEVTVEAFEYLP